MQNRYKWWLGGALLLLTACAQKEEILLGERLTLDGEAVSTSPATGGGAPALNLRTAQINTSWTHQARNASHAIGHVALGKSIAQIWATPIGAGDGKRNRVTSSPVVDGGVVYALDGFATVTAVSTNGAPLWSRDLTPSANDAQQTSGGGVALGSGLVIATTAYGEVSGIDQKTGDIVWTQDLIGFGGSAPTIFKDIVYLSSRDGSAWAIEAKTGKIRWQILGPEKISGRAGGPGPLVTDKWSVFPFGTGELLSTYRQGGLQNWSAIVSGARRGPAVSRFNDITGDPVLDGQTIYVGNASGRLAAINLDDGVIEWTTGQGVVDHIITSGASLFILNDQGKLMRLAKSGGAVIWSVDLPRFTTQKEHRRREIHAYYGPVLAGGQLYVAGSDGTMRVFDPRTGALVRVIELGSGATGAPVVANQVMYLVTADGALRAFR